MWPIGNQSGFLICLPDAPYSLNWSSSIKHPDNISLEEQRQVDDLVTRFRKALKERPEISDEEFMAETEVSDEEYARGFGVILSGSGEEVE